MANDLTFIYRGANPSGATAGVAYLDIVRDGTLIGVYLKAFTAQSGDAVFEIQKNGVVISGLDDVTIPNGQESVSIGSLNVALVQGDEIKLNLLSGSVTAPITLNLVVDDGESPGGVVPGADKIPDIPGDIDDEFDASMLDAAWTEVAPTGNIALRDYAGRIGSALFVNLNVNGVLYLEKPFTPIGDFSITLAGWIYAAANYSGIDILIRDGGTATTDPEATNPEHNNDYWMTTNHASGVKTEIHKRVGGAARNYAITTPATFIEPTDKVYMHVQRVAGAWSFYVSTNGVIWFPVLIDVSAHNFTPTKMMIALRGNASSKAHGAFDWVRRDWLYL